MCVRTRSLDCSFSIPTKDRISEGVPKNYGGTGIVIPQKTQESGGFLQE
jgi:hypothetical protein